MRSDTSTTVQDNRTDRTQNQNRKKLVVIILCLFLCVILIFALSRMKYTTPEMRGKVSYEPALFNTVLLGKLVDTDINKLTNINEETYTMADASASNADTSESTSQTYHQKVTGQKITTSLDLTRANELGDRQSTSGFARVAPGDTANAHIPFTITNGTTVADDDTNTAKKRNVAKSDIRYTIHILSTENLPLTYQIKDLSTEETYKLGVYQTSDDSGEGFATDYIVADNDNENSKASIFHNGSRLLKCNSDGSITVHQYELLVSWPAEKGEDGVAFNDLKYMKELENVEVRVEVESYVNYVSRTQDTTDQKAEGILVVQGSPVSDKYYTLENQNGEQSVYAQKTVRFDNLKVTDENGTNTGSYTFYACNGDSVSAKWTSDTEDETSPTRKSNGKSPKDGHYTYSGSYQSGSYGVLLAVPTDKWDTANSGNTVKMTYNGDTYLGVESTEEAAGVFTTEHVKEKKENATEYKDKKKKAYQLIRFYKLNQDGNKTDEELTLNSFGSSFQKEKVELEFSGSIVSNAKTKNDFRIYLNKK